MSGTLPVSLGGLLLTGAAVPSSYDHVGRMRTAIHRVIGGGRVIQALGTDPQKRQLSGCFLGPDASNNGLLLEAMRDAGTPLVLTIGAWTEYVLLTTVSIRYSEQGCVAPYFLEAEPILASPDQPTVTTTSIIAGIVADLSQSAGSLTAQTSTGSIQDIQGSLTTAATTISQTAGSDLTNLADPALALQSVVTSSDAAVTSIGTRAPSGSLVASGGDLSTAQVTLLSLATAVQAGGYLNRANCSLSQLGGVVALPLVHS